MDVVWLTQAAAVWDLEFCILTVAFRVHNWYRGLVKLEASREMEREQWGHLFWSEWKRGQGRCRLT